MEKLQSLAIDIKHSVFDNDTEAIMYITKDIYSDSFIIAIPAITFSWQIEDERDYIYLSRANIFGDKDRQELLVLAIKEGIRKFEY